MRNLERWMHRVRLKLRKQAMTTKDTTNDMKITGNVAGDIAGRTITVSKSGSVNGSLGADTVVISGEVNGIVKANKIEVLSTAYIIGELLYDRLSVNPGAHMEARCTPTAA
jgi:cytoskeletal protein CcmA (bactofilin family)